METTEITETTETTITKAEQITHILNHFTGSNELHRFSPISSLVITDGVKYLCDKAGSYWLMDIIASYQSKCKKDPMLAEFQLWKLKVKDNKGVVTCERDTDDVAIKQLIPYTDFPLSEIKLYCENGVISLPSER